MQVFNYSRQGIPYLNYKSENIPIKNMENTEKLTKKKKQKKIT